MTSAEPGRKTAYSPDIGWRVVWQRLAMQSSFEAIALRLQIAPSTAHRIFSQFKRTGDVLPEKQPQRETMRKLDDLHELLILSAVITNPGLYLRELCHLVAQSTGTCVSGSTICRLLRKHGFSRKKIQQVARQRCVIFRADYVARIMQYPKRSLVFVDETGCDARNHIRKFGYALKGEPPVYHRFLVHGKRVSAIAAISTDGLLGVELKTGTNNAESFADFVRGTLLPSMQPFDGSNSSSVAVMDNCTIHHAEHVKELFQQAGIPVIFLPPYSPDYNPIELTFSYVKYYLKDHDEELQLVPMCDTRAIIQSAFESITVELCNKWIDNCLYD